MITVDSKALSMINRFLSEKIPVLVMCPSGIVAAEWQRKIKYLPCYQRDLCKVKMSLNYKHPTVITKDSVVVYPDFSKKNLTSKVTKDIIS